MDISWIYLSIGLSLLFQNFDGIFFLAYGNYYYSESVSFD